MQIFGQCELEILPAEIGQLSHLQRLEIWVNESLKAIPAEIGQLTHLQRLGLTGNALDTLPSEIGQLSRLQHLALGRNKLENPYAIGQWAELDQWYQSHLQYLDLRSNALETLPSEIGQLICLRYLDLRDNSYLRTLPLEMGQLTRLQWLGIPDHYNMSLEQYAELELALNLLRDQLPYVT